MGTVWHEINTVFLGFSRAGHGAPDGARAAPLFGYNVPISGRADSRESDPYKEKRTLPGAVADISEVDCVTALVPCGTISVLRFWNINQIPFRREAGRAFRILYTVPPPPCVATGDALREELQCLCKRPSPPFQNGVPLWLRAD